METIYPSHNSSSTRGSYGTSAQTHQNTQRTLPQPAQTQVGFRDETNDEYEEERKKYLTAKYGQHQMRLIRKRLKVEDWVDQQLTKLYDVSETESYDCEIDLDELLDIDDDQERRLFLQEKVSNAKKPTAVINEFIDELLQKAHTL